MTSFHSDATTSDIHVPHFRTYDDETARLADTPTDTSLSDVASTDIDKWALQEDTGEYYSVDSVDPVVWVLKAGGDAALGDVVGPASSTDNAIPKFDTTTGILLQDTGVLIDDSDVVLAPSEMVVGGSSVSVTDASVHLQATDKALVHNRLTTTQRDALTPTRGMTIYNTTTDDVEFYNSVSWQSMGGGDVVGPAVSTDDAIVTFNGTGGKNIQTSNITIDVTGMDFPFGSSSHITMGAIEATQFEINKDTDTFLTSNEGDFTLDNTDTSGSIIFGLGTDTITTTVEVRNDSDEAVFTVKGNGLVNLPDDGILALGDDNDIQITHDNTFADIHNKTGNLIIRNSDAGNIVARLGDDLVTSKFHVQNISQEEIFTVTASSGVLVNGTLAVDEDTSVTGMLTVNGSVDVDSDFNVSTAVLSGGTFDASNEDTEYRGLIFNDDGLMMFLVGRNNDEVYTYSLTRAYDAATASLTRSYSITDDNLPIGVNFNTDGTKMYILGDQNDTLFEYTLTTGFDTDTATLSTSFDYSTNSPSGRGFCFGSNGSKLYIATSTEVDEYTLSTPFLIDTASFIQSLDVSSESTFAIDCHMGASGDRFFLLFATNDVLYEYRLSTAFDIATARTLASFDFTPTENVPKTFNFNDTGTKLFVNGTQNDQVMEYNLNSLNLLGSVQIEEGDLTLDDGDIFVNGNKVSPDSKHLITVESAADLPVPESGVITSADDTVYLLKEDIDISPNSLLTGSNSFFVGIKEEFSIIFSTTSTAMISSDGFAMNFENVGFDQEGTGELIDVSGGGTSVHVFDKCRFFGDIVRLTGGSSATFRDCAFNEGARLVQDGSGGVNGISLIDQTGLVDLGTATDGLLTFESGSSTATCIVNNVGIVMANAASKGIVVEEGATIDDLFINQVQFRAVISGPIAVEVGDPDEIANGTLQSIDYVGDIDPYRCNPTSSSNFSSPNTGAVAIGIDSDGNLIIASPDNDLIYRMVGLTSTVDTSIATPASDVYGVVWSKGNLISADEVTNTIYVHSGFTTTISTSFATPASNVSGITFDGNNLITTDSVTNLIYVHDGISSTILESFASPTTGDAGIGYDGINLVVTDGGANDEVVVLKGKSATEQYRFDAPNTSVSGLVITPTGAAIIDDTADTVYLYDHPITFDHSSRTWDVTNVGTGITQSSDRGGSQYADETFTGVAVTLSAVDVWTDISATGIAYGPFDAMEKCRLNDETNGEIIWTASRDRGRVIVGQALITRTGNNTDRFYQLALCINGVIQKDSISTQVLPDTSTYATIQSLPITMDLTEDDTLLIQIRSVTDTQAPVVISSKVSIN